MAKVLGLDPAIGVIYIVNILLIVLWVVFSVANAKRRGDL
ncbi:hypothetical protein Ferp_2314 [Ferroglobus placidus DSM 10642]|uniref:Uncharacterized protein n=1 Tax=Ferroglobus placidus (strain DSM 10642 / AEDII12DO) TaxID=589924 RepID=D3S1H4_FERPA|nr:hypothetical protein Ferp_2314 [Ferroglobus placidus DSM 10642]